MWKTFTYLLFAFLLFVSQVSLGQNIGSYQLIERGHVGELAQMNGSRQLIGRKRTNVASRVETIGFDFVFMGKVYNTFSVNSNGVLRLGDEVVLAGANTYGIPGNDRIVPLAGVQIEERTWWWWNSMEGDLGTGASGKVHYKILGSAPERTLVVEWREMEIPFGGGGAGITFQLHLHESAISSEEKSGNIEFIYDEGSMGNNHRNFQFRTGFGIGPEQGNFVAIDHEKRETVNEQNFVSGPVSGVIPYFESNNNHDKLLYSFASARRPTGVFSNFEIICPAPNALSIRFEENCLNEAGIVVYRKLQHQPDAQFKLVANLPPDSRSFSDGGVGLGARYVYRFYLLGEGRYSETFTDFETEPVVGGMAFQAVKSGKWSNSAVWGGTKPHSANDVEVGCAATVFLSTDTDVTVRNLTIHKGSFLTVDNGVTLYVSGDFVNNGVFNPIGTARLVLNGQNHQTVTNNGKGLTNDLLFTAPAGVPRWNNNETGLVAEKTIQVNETEFEAIKAVEVDIDQDFLRDLTLYLITPDGTSFTLSRGRGQQGQDYNDVVFIETGQPLPPSVQNVNLSGEYRPEESFAAYKGPFNGNWTLQVRDGFTGAGGSLNAFRLTLSKGGSNDLVMRRVSVENSSADGIVLNSGMVIQDHLQLIEGIVHANESAKLVFESGASCDQGNANSFVDGPVLKKGDENFVFPLGNEGKWAPLGIENLRGANISTTFKAAYHKQAPANVEQLEEDLVKVSRLEYWDLSPVSGNATLDLVLHWKDAEESQIIDVTGNDLTVAHFTSGKWKNEEGKTLSGSGTGEGGSGAVRAIDVSTFSPFTFGSRTGSNPLPVEFISFTGKEEMNGIALNWATATENNNSHFEIQRSTNAVSWEKVGSVKGMGTTIALQKYRFYDRNVGLGNYFYRLKQVDFDGAFDYSSVIAVNKSGGISELEVFPNPAKKRVSLKSSFYPAEMVIWSQSGVSLFRKKIKSEKTSFDLPELAKGVYVISLTHAQGVEYRKLLISE